MRKLLLAVAILCAVPAVAAAQARPGELEGEGKPVAWVHFRGNRKAEDDAIRLAIGIRAGDKLTAEKLRDDIKNVWKMGYFEDVQVELTDEKDGKVGLTFVLREKPVIRKIYLSGQSEVSVDKINEVLDLKKETILDPAKIKRN